MIDEEVRVYARTPVYDAHKYLRDKLEMSVDIQLDRIGEFYRVVRKQSPTGLEDDNKYRGRIRYRIDRRIHSDRDL